MNKRRLDARAAREYANDVSIECPNCRSRLMLGTRGPAACSDAIDEAIDELLDRGGEIELFPVEEAEALLREHRAWARGIES